MQLWDKPLDQPPAVLDLAQQFGPLLLQGRHQGILSSGRLTGRVYQIPALVASSCSYGLAARGGGCDPPGCPGGCGWPWAAARLLKVDILRLKNVDKIPVLSEYRTGIHWYHCTNRTGLLFRRDSVVLSNPYLFHSDSKPEINDFEKKKNRKNKTEVGTRFSSSWSSIALCGFPKGSNSNSNENSRYFSLTLIAIKLYGMVRVLRYRTALSRLHIGYWLSEQ